MNGIWSVVVGGVLALASFSTADPAIAAGSDKSSQDVRPLRARVGGGNLVTHLAGQPPTIQLYEALKGVGAKSARMDSYGWRNLEHKPTPENFDAAMMEAYKHGITPIILLEYEGSYQSLNPPQLIGTRAEWEATGEAYARRFRPNGDWGRAHGIKDWGVTIYTAVNEPDVQATIPRKAYHDALQGFAEGIHKIDPALKVVPGGFARCNSDGDATLRGYAAAIGDLLEDGALDGIDLHTYYNARWYPIEKGRDFSAQACFDKVKAQLGVSRDIAFYATEYNVSRDFTWENPEVAAGLFLTGFWDEMGIVGDDGKTGVSVLAYPWNLADTVAQEGPVYAMAAGDKPWRPEIRAEVLKRVLDIAGDMHFTRLDPKVTGTFDLSGPNGDLRVWQDRPGWTDHVATAWTLDVPAFATTAELWSWRGKIATAKPVNGRVRFSQLSGHDTYMVYFPRRKP